MIALRMLLWLLVPVALIAVNAVGFGFLYGFVTEGLDSPGLRWFGFGLYWTVWLCLFGLAHLFCLTKAGQWASIWYMSGIAAVGSGLWLSVYLTINPGDMYALLFSLACGLVALVYAQLYVRYTTPKTS
jgi:hypothetical protein